MIVAPLMLGSLTHQYVDSERIVRAFFLCNRSSVDRQTESAGR